MTPEPTDRPVPVWKEQAREHLHRAIMDAARATFAEKGYHTATSEEIAHRADVGKGTVYNYVEGGKGGLFLTMLAEHFDELEALAAQLLADEEVPLRTRFTAYATAFASYFERHRDLLFVHLRDVPQLVMSGEGGEVVERLRNQRLRLIEMLVPALEGAMARGEIRRLPAAVTAHVVFMTLMGYLFRFTAGNCPWPGAPETPIPEQDPADVAAYLTTLLFDGLAC